MCVRTASVFGERYNESEVRGSVVGAKKNQRDVRKMRGGGLCVYCGGQRGSWDVCESVYCYHYSPLRRSSFPGLA